MRGNKTMMATVALGAAYLLRNEKSRGKVMEQLQALGMNKKK